MTKRLMAVAIVLVAVCLLAAITPGLTAQPLQEQEKVTPPVRTDALPTATAQGGLIWFTNQVDFEAFNAGEGKVLKGVENFEESTLFLNSIEGFDDPLESGVPNLPDGFPFPEGMTGLPNLIVQSNTLANDPVDESPQGVNGLAAASNGFAGGVSDTVVSNTLVNGLDLIFTEGKSGVGFNTIDFLGPQTGVIVRVFRTDNVFLGMMPSPAEPTGANFIGVWSDAPIGRINIFSGGAEGADNIQAWQTDERPTGACCFDDGSCIEVTAVDCTAAGGVYQGNDTSCKPNPCPQPCPWDFDGNGVVGASDLLELLTNWGPCP